jgi:hypothetical protein
MRRDVVRLGRGFAENVPSELDALPVARLARSWAKPGPPCSCGMRTTLARVEAHRDIAQARAAGERLAEEVR